MSITFVALPWMFPTPHFQTHEGYSQNLGVGYLASFLRKHGFESDFIDGFAEGVDQRTEMSIGKARMYVYGLTPSQVVERLSPDTKVVGITCPFNQQAPLIEPLAAAIKEKYPNVLVVLGGPYAISFPQEALHSNPHVDIVVRGEGEVPLLDILSGKPKETIGGILFNKPEGGVFDGGLAAVVANMDDLPFPERELLPMDQYFGRSARGGDLKHAKPVSFTTSRGCPYKCEFCSLHNEENSYGYEYRYRSPENVMAEIDQLKAMYGEDLVIQFEDDNILIRRDRAKELFRQLATKNVKWAIHSGVMIKLIDEEMIILMKESGCQQLNLALESGNETVLRAMRKELKLEHAANVVRWGKKHGIKMLAFLMIGYPGETDATWAQTLVTLRKLKKLGLQQVARFIVNAHPGTPLYSAAKEKGWLRNVDEAVYNCSIVQLETDDFDEAKVRGWYASVEDVMNPVRVRTKRALQTFLPAAAYVGVRAAVQKVRLMRQAVG